MPSHSSSLNAAQLAALFSQMERLESAGLPTFQAFSLLTQTDASLKKPLAMMQQQLKSGRPISVAGFRAGIFDDTLKTLVHAAEISGRLAQVYAQLASHYTNLHRRTQQIKSRLYFPAATLLIALLVQPLPALVSAEISTPDYLRASLGRFFFMAMCALLLVRLPAILRGLGAEAEWHRLQLIIPAVARWIMARQVNAFFFMLAMMLESGLAFNEAFPEAVATIKNTRLKAQFDPALAMIGSGASVTDTLGKVPLIHATILHVVNSSEQSGKLASGILHFIRQEAENLSRQDDALAEWLPRLIYALIAAWMAYALLGSRIM